MNFDLLKLNYIQDYIIIKFKQSFFIQ